MMNSMGLTVCRSIHILRDRVFFVVIVIIIVGTDTNTHTHPSNFMWFGFLLNFIFIASWFCRVLT